MGTNPPSYILIHLITVVYCNLSSVSFSFISDVSTVELFLRSYFQNVHTWEPPSYDRTFGSTSRTYKETFRLSQAISGISGATIGTPASTSENSRAISGSASGNCGSTSGYFGTTSGKCGSTSGYFGTTSGYCASNSGFKGRLLGISARLLGFVRHLGIIGRFLVLLSGHPVP